MTFVCHYEEENDAPWWAFWRKPKKGTLTFRSTTLNGDVWINVDTGDRAYDVLERKFTVFRRKMLKEGHRDAAVIEITIR